MKASATKLHTQTEASFSSIKDMPYIEAIGEQQLENGQETLTQGHESQLS